MLFRSLDKLIAMENSALVRAVNETMVTQADRYVYGAHDGVLNFVEHWLAPVGGGSGAKSK